MKKMQYVCPAVKVLDARLGEMMFTPGGGISEANPQPPVVNPAPANNAADESFELPHYSVWDDWNENDINV